MALPRRIVRERPGKGERDQHMQSASLTKQQTITTYAQAVQTVDPALAIGHPHLIWVAFAKYYEKNGTITGHSSSHTLILF